MTASCWESTARMARLKPEASYWAKLQWVAQVHCYQSLTRIQRTVEIMSFSRGHRPCCCFFLIFIVFVFVFLNAPFLSRWLLPLWVFFLRADHFLSLSQLKESRLVLLLWPQQFCWCALVISVGFTCYYLATEQQPVLFWPLLNTSLRFTVLLSHNNLPSQHYERHLPNA